MEISTDDSRLYSYMIDIEEAEKLQQTIDELQLELRIALRSTAQSSMASHSLAQEVRAAALRGTVAAEHSSQRVRDPQFGEYCENEHNGPLQSDSLDPDVGGHVMSTSLPSLNPKTSHVCIQATKAPRPSPTSFSVTFSGFGNKPDETTPVKASRSHGQIRVPETPHITTHLEKIRSLECEHQALRQRIRAFCEQSRARGDASARRESCEQVLGSILSHAILSIHRNYGRVIHFILQ